MLLTNKRKESKHLMKWKCIIDAKHSTFENYSINTDNHNRLRFKNKKYIEFIWKQNGVSKLTTLKFWWKEKRRFDSCNFSEIFRKNF